MYLRNVLVQGTLKRVSAGTPPVCIHLRGPTMSHGAGALSMMSSLSHGAGALSVMSSLLHSMCTLSDDLACTAIWIYPSLLLCAYHSPVLDAVMNVFYYFFNFSIIIYYLFLKQNSFLYSAELILHCVHHSLLMSCFLCCYYYIICVIFADMTISFASAISGH